MIIYTTKETRERLKLKMPNELNPTLSEFIKKVISKESGNFMFEWGAKLFYFDRRKCLQVVHFASKLTLFLIDIKVKDIEKIGDMMAFYIFELYKDKPNLTKKIEKFFALSPFICFDKITNKSIITTLNHTESDFAFYGNRFYEYIKNNILHSKQINYDVNFKFIFSSSLDKSDMYFHGGERFEKLILEYIKD